jgi:excisionase family DNA binding protein
MEKYLTVFEISKLLRTSIGTVYRLVKARKIPHKKFGKRYLFSPLEIEGFISKTDENNGKRKNNN